MSPGGLAFIGANTRFRISAHNIPLIRGLLNEVKVIVTSTPNGFIPDFTTIGINFNDPVICTAFWVLAFIAGNGGRGIPGQYKTSVNGLLKRMETIPTTPAIGVVPKFIASGIQFYYPI